MNKTKEIVLKAIEDLRPYLHNDGGDMELVEITKDNKVIVKLLGACQTCSVSSVTMKAGLEENLKVLAPEITAVEALQVALFRSLTASTVEKSSAASSLAQAMADKLTTQELEQAKAGAIEMAVREQQGRKANG